MELIESLHKVLKPLIGKKITSTAIVDIFNLIGRCVVAGGVRRTAEVMFGEANDNEFMRLKDPKNNLEALQSHRWASNNSVFAQIGQDYSQISDFIANNGEPGVMWLDNAQQYSRMCDPPDGKDRAIMGANPCLEQSLESAEICNLVELFPARLTSFDEFKLALKYAYLYAKSITLVPTHNLRTNAVMLRNRRIGTSCSGITQAFKKHGRREFFNWCNNGYKYLEDLDDEYSRWLCIPKSIKKTSVKPSGTISLLNGSSPGIHYPIAEYYWRVVRFASDSSLVKSLRKAGYKCIEIDPKKEPNTTAVYFPIKENFFDRAEEDVSMWEQLENAAAMQSYWCDNQVSVTIKFKPEEAKDIKKALELYENRLKAVSFLPLDNHGYEHAPYQKITKDEYEVAIKKLKTIDYSNALHEKEDKFCDGDKCEISLSKEL
jgi:ribonucleoside-triphosphate reductase (thioredoxin)